MFRTVFTRKQPVTSFINPTPIISRSYSKSLDLEAEALRIKVETRRLKELKEQQLKQKQQLRDEKVKQKIVEEAKKSKERLLTQQAEQRMKKAKALELERQKKRKQRESLREIEKKQQKKLEDLRKKATQEQKKSARKNLPSRPILGLFWYTSEHFKSIRAELVAQDLPSSAPDVLKVVADRYKNLSAEKKVKYLKLESGERERYQREKAAYDKKKKAQVPARNSILRSYMRFCIEVRQEVTQSNPTLQAPQIAQKMGEMWRELSEEKKKEYKQAYERDVAALAESQQQE